MATPNSDIVPIQLSLTAGDLITLWAPRWREDGEDWEAFLGDDDSVFAFSSTAALAAFVRTVDEHDLSDHPAWPIVRQLSVTELVPEDNQCYDLVGVPEVAASEPDTWAVGELAGIVRITRSLAETCGLSVVSEVLDAAPGFGVLDQGSWAFSGREGGRLWEELTATVAGRWDEVLDAVDALVHSPEVDATALAEARRELPSDTAIGTQPAPRSHSPEQAEPIQRDGATASEDTNASEDTLASQGTTVPADTSGFWEHVGIDPILITTAQGTHYTLRCYLDDKPVFLGAHGRIDVLPSARALARHLADAGMDGHDLARASTWPEVAAAAEAGELTVEVDPENTYLLTGLAEDLADGPVAVDSHQLDLGVELLLDVGEWAGDDGARLALSSSQSLGWLTSFVLRPDPTRLAPSPPFDAEAGRWNALVDELVARLHRP
ncbi:MAG: primosomal protein [Actinomycetota bacterium]|nr:primosomal protein [Actinomycetota bacterium]